MCNSNRSFDNLEKELQDPTLLKKLSFKLEEAITQTKNSREEEFIKLLSGFRLKISIEISDDIVKTEEFSPPPLPKRFFARNTSLRQCWGPYIDEDGVQRFGWVDC